MRFVTRAINCSLFNNVYFFSLFSPAEPDDDEITSTISKKRQKPSATTASKATAKVASTQIKRVHSTDRQERGPTHATAFS
jgi:hypothetical protein